MCPPFTVRYNSVSPFQPAAAVSGRTVSLQSCDRSQLGALHSPFTGGIMCTIFAQCGTAWQFILPLSLPQV